MTRPVTLNAAAFTCGANPMSKKEMCGGDLTATLKRTDFGMKYAVPAIGDEVKLTPSRPTRSSELRLLLALLLALAVARPAMAWGPQGHEVVALVADGLLTPAAHRRVDAILALEPGATLTSVASWADQTREAATASWHYVNLPRDAGCEYVAERDCSGGDCVVGALASQARKLNTSTGKEQLDALKYVVHFAADVHQPLHVGFADDRGGNSYQLQAFGRGTNLHAVWDSGLLRSIDADPQSLAATVRARPLPQPAASLAFAPGEWAAESCRIVGRPGFYPERVLPAEYAQIYAPVALDRLQLAGRRLAALLNDLLR